MSGHNGDVELTVVDAFTDRPFSGNPAAVAVVGDFPAEERMQEIAREMNLSETAFVREVADSRYSLRWFTPTTEVDLCGHATLAAAHVLGQSVEFVTRSGMLRSNSSEGWIYLDFPAWHPTELPLPRVLPRTTCAWTGVAGDDWLIELEAAEDVVGYVPDFAAIGELGRRALIVTAEAPLGSEYDIVSRVFAPSVGVTEDPVTGSAYCALAPYWADRLGRIELVGYQASARGGVVRMRLADDRVVIGGQAVTVSRVTVVA
jgi:predicted PhzF superfamily epimerase YddE/YHI9